MLNMMESDPRILGRYTEISEIDENTPWFIQQTATATCLDNS